MGAAVGMFHRWRRTALAAVLCVAATVFGLGPAGPAAAARPAYTKIHQVYGVTYSGALVTHEYFQDNGDPAGQTVRRITAAGWATGGEVFSGRYIRGSDPLTSVVYQVSRSGALLWYSDEGGASLGVGVPVGAQFGDWRQFRSLFSPGHGRIYGIDRAGRVLGWVHHGFRDGSDVWEGPDVVATGFGPTRRLVGAWPGNEAVVGIDRTEPWFLKFWGKDGRESSRTPIVGAFGSGPLTWSGGPDVGYGRSWTGRILELKYAGGQLDRESGWVASELDTARFARVFAGGRWQLLDPQPYEWQ